jgi:pheromone a factor receptor
MATCLYMAWTGLACLILFINSIVWNKNMINRAPVYCDIGKCLVCCFPNVY